MQIYLDESGDLGWTFDKPNQDGGSSRFITICGVVIAAEHEKHINRYIKEVYRKYNLNAKIEKKGANFSDEDATYISRNLNAIYTKAPSFKIISITAKKEKVYESLRRDCNIFYNYMLGVLLPDTMRTCTGVELIIDKRTIKVKSGNSFEDYIKTKCWGELNLSVGINCTYDSSDQNEGIWLADWFANWIWRHHENKRSDAYAEIAKLNRTFFFEKTLFF